MKTAYFNRFTLDLPDEAIADCSHQGPCDDDVAHWHKDSRVQAALSEIPDNALAAELAEYGAWEDAELLDRKHNEEIIIWLAAGNIADELANESALV